MSFRDNLLHLRAANNMTQEQLAMLLGVSRQSVTKWEAEKSYPEMDKLLKLCQVFDCTLDELVQGDLTSRTSSLQAVAGAQGLAADVFDYDGFMRRFASRIAWGIFAVVAGVGLSLPLFGAADPTVNPCFSLPENIAAALGVLLVFAGIAACLASIVPAGLSYSAFVRAHPYIEDFYTAEDKAKARTSFSCQLIGGMACVLVGVCIVILFADGPASIFGVTLLMLSIAAGALLIVRGSMLMARTNIAAYNAEAAEFMEVGEIESANLPEASKQEMLQAKKVDQKVGAVCGAIMILATAIALLMLVWPMAAGHTDDYSSGTMAFFWIPWPIGGLLCGITALLVKAFAREE